MGNLVDYILEHEQGGLNVVADYVSFLVSSDVAKTLLETLAKAPITVDEMESRQSNLYNHERAQGLVLSLVEKGWGNLPRIKENFEYLLKESFPEDYQGVEIPEELDDSGSKIYTRADTHMPESK